MRRMTIWYRWRTGYWLFRAAVIAALAFLVAPVAANSLGTTRSTTASPPTAAPKGPAKPALPAWKAEAHQQLQELLARLGVDRWQEAGYRGRGVNQSYSEAMRLFRQAADLGDPQAMNNIGVMYSEGQSVPKNEAEAARWFRKAANPEPR